MEVVYRSNTVDERRHKVLELLRNQSQLKELKYPSTNQHIDHNKEFNIRDFSSYPEIKAFLKQKSIIEACKVENPYFRVSDGITANTAKINGRSMVSFSCYNYLGFSGHPKVTESAKQAIDQYGTSPSASRLVSGEKPIHCELEQAISRFLGTEQALVFASGHATNVTVLGHFFNSQDLIIYDEFSHNSIIEGCLLSGARRIPFLHNNADHCRQIIQQNINLYQKLIVVIEGAYSMDGDLSPLNKLVELREQFPILLYVDEAHSLGTVGNSGRGIGEYYGVKPSQVDFWMGTLSKAMASNGGYIAGKRELIEYLKYTTPGFVYAAGMTPANAAAALTSIKLLEEDSSRLHKLQYNADFFRDQAKTRGFNIGRSKDTPIIPVIIGDTSAVIRTADKLFAQGINVHPIFYPSVPLNEARLRFFISSEHTEEELLFTIQSIERCLNML